MAPGARHTTRERRVQPRRNVQTNPPDPPRLPGPADRANVVQHAPGDARNAMRDVMRTRANDFRRTLQQKPYKPTDDRKRKAAAHVEESSSSEEDDHDEEEEAQMMARRSSMRIARQKSMENAFKAEGGEEEVDEDDVDAMLSPPDGKESVSEWADDGTDVNGDESSTPKKQRTTKRVKFSDDVKAAEPDGTQAAHFADALELKLDNMTRDIRAIKSIVEGLQRNGSIVQAFLEDLADWREACKIAGGAGGRPGQDAGSAVAPAGVGSVGGRVDGAAAERDQLSDPDEEMEGNTREEVKETEAKDAKKAETKDAKKTERLPRRSRE